MAEKQTLQPIPRSSPEKYTEHMAREEGAVKTTSRRSFLAGAASAVAAATVGSTSGALAAPLEKSGYGNYLQKLLNEEGVVFHEV